LTLRGYDDIVVGMTLREASEATGWALASQMPVVIDEDGCGVAPFSEGVPGNVLFNVDGGSFTDEGFAWSDDLVIVSVNVRTGPTTTVEGVDIGATPGEVRALHPSAREVPEQWYGGASYYLVVESEPGYRTNFAIGDDGRVAYMETGVSEVPDDGEFRPEWWPWMDCDA